jgi:hypothetical protein
MAYENIAKLRITPAMGAGPSNTTYWLRCSRGSYFIDIIQTNYGQIERHRVPIDSIEVKHQLLMLRQATVPAFPVTPPTFDGEHIELTIEGEYSSMCMSWWTVAPQGAEALLEFINWMCCITADKIRREESAWSG